MKANAKNEAKGESSRSGETELFRIMPCSSLSLREGHQIFASIGALLYISGSGNQKTHQGRRRQSISSECERIVHL